MQNRAEATNCATSEVICAKVMAPVVDEVEDEDEDTPDGTLFAEKSRAEDATSG